MYTTLITGATGGLGRAFCELCAKRGDRLVLSATKTENLEKLKEELLKNFPNTTIDIKKCDLSLQGDRDGLFEYLKLNNITIDFLINNAGYIIEGDFLSVDDQTALKAIKVNCEGTLDITQKVIKNRDDSKLLKIITISSQAGNYPMPHMAIYSASKSFLTSFMLSLAEEVKDKNIKITTICPSGIYTSNAMIEAINSQGKLGKWTGSTPKYIAEFAIKMSDKNKVYAIPKFINRLIDFSGKFLKKTTVCKLVGKRWKKSQNKRNI